MTSNSKAKVSSLQYSLMAMPIAMLGLPIYIYLPSYYAAEFSISLSIIGFALLLARVIDVFTDPMIGVWSDKVSHKFSREKQITFGAIGLALFITPLFLPYPDWVGGIYLFVFSFFSYFAWTMIQVPYLALAAEYPVTSDKRRTLIAWREALTIIGVLFMLLLPFALGYQVTQQGFYQWFVVIFIALLLFSLILLRSIKTTAKSTIQAKTPQSEMNSEQGMFASLRESYYQLQQTKQHHPEALRILPPYFLNNLANAIPATLFLIFVEQYLKLTEQAGVFLLLYFIAGIMALPLWLKAANKYGRIKVWRISIMLSVISFLLVFGLEEGSATLYLIICLLTGLSVAIDIALPASLQADISHRIEEKSFNMHGVLFGLWGMLTKLSLALAVGISLPLVDWLATLNLQGNAGMLLVYALPAILLKVYVWWQLKKIQVQLSTQYN